MMLKRHLSKVDRARQIVNFEYRRLGVIDRRSNPLRHLDDNPLGIR